MTDPNHNDAPEYRCKVCNHWPEEHHDGGCAGCDAAGHDMSIIEHEYIPDLEGEPENV
jgi:hypothetical protein